MTRVGIGEESCYCIYMLIDRSVGLEVVGDRVGGGERSRPCEQERMERSMEREDK